MLADLREVTNQIEAEYDDSKTEEEFQTEIQEIGNKLKEIAAKRSTFRDELKNYQTTLRDTVEKELEDKQPILDELREEMQAAENEMQEHMDEIQRVENEIFSDFAEKIGVSSIQEYEDSKVGRVEERARREAYLNSQKQGLQNSLEFEQKRLQRFENQVDELNTKRKRIEKDLTKFEKRHTSQQKKYDKLLETMNKDEKKWQDSKTEAKKSELQLKATRTELAEIKKKLSKAQRKRDNYDSFLESIDQRKDAIMDEARLENITIHTLRQQSPGKKGRRGRKGGKGKGGRITGGKRKRGGKKGGKGKKKGKRGKKDKDETSGHRRKRRRLQRGESSDENEDELGSGDEDEEEESGSVEASDDEEEEEEQDIDVDEDPFVGIDFSDIIEEETALQQEREQKKKGKGKGKRKGKRKRKRGDEDEEDEDEDEDDDEGSQGSQDASQGSMEVESGDDGDDDNGNGDDEDEDDEDGDSEEKAEILDENANSQKNRQRRNLNKEERRAYFESEIEKLTEDISRLRPNMKAIVQYDSVSNKCKRGNKEQKQWRKRLKGTYDALNHVENERAQRFNDAFDRIKENIGGIYAALTKTKKFRVGGSASLGIGSQSKPFESDVTYTAIPPNKQFRDMDQLSGGEKSVASLALLFAIHSYRPSPFFILDEVDAALDNVNVRRVSDYIRERARKDGLQTIVISLKDKFYCKADALVGVCKDRSSESSLAIGIDLQQYPLPMSQPQR